MANYYGTEQIERLKQSIDIVNVVEMYVPLKKQGVNFMACCPFHEEKTPSFVVYPDSQTFHCFGGSCHKGGDVIHFVQEMDKLDFSEAVESLAEKYNIQLTPERSRTTQPEKPSVSKNDMFKANEQALSYYKKCLSSPEAAPAVKYLADRGISREMIQEFGIGYASPGLITHLRSIKANSVPFEQTGLVGRSEYSDSWYEKFQNRIMFPIFDIRSRVAGFGARILESAGSNKYINSPASPVFNKREMVYGIHLLKHLSGDNAPVIVVEGYTDVIGLYQNGIRGAVATLGTALTAEHIHKLKRFTDSFILLFDADEAGIKAAERSIELFIKEETSVRLVTLPEQKDPFEYVTQYGPEAFKAELAKAAGMYEFRKNLLEKEHGTDSPAAVNRIINGLVSTFSKTPSSVSKELYYRNIHEDYGVSLEAISELEARHSNNGHRGGNRIEEKPRVSNALLEAEKNIVRTVLAYPELFPDTYRQINPSHFSDSECRSIFETCIKLFDREGVLLTEKLFSLVTDADSASRISTYINEKEAFKRETAEALNRDSIRHILREDFDRKIAEIKKKYSEAEQKGDSDEIRKNLALLNVFQKQKHALSR